MLTPQDESLLHQAPTTFDHAVTSDHRFFDRWAVGVQHRSASVIYGMATYKNLDVCDGFLCVQVGDRQHNVRVSRPLRPEFSMRVGPLAIEVLEPLWSHRVRLDDVGVQAELTWTGGLPAREEHPHHLRRHGRAESDYMRFDQLGTASGWVEAGGERVELDRAFAWRDHSWGVRPGVGGRDPAARSAAGEPEATLFVWMAFRAGTVAGQFQTREGPGGQREVLDGHVLADTEDPASVLGIADLRHRLAFADTTSALTGAELEVTTTDGRRWSFDVTPLRPAWAFCGAGYSGGWDDRLGLGVPRGERIERDGYTLPGPADVIFPDGSVQRPWHREHDVALTVNGVAGDGHFTVVNRGPLPPATLRSP